MRRFRFRTINCFLALLGSFAIAGKALAEEGARWLLQTSIYTTHFNNRPHNNNQKLVNLEYQRADQWVVGGAAFDTSFDQFAQYLYFGRLWRPFETEPLIHVKLTGGLIHGYKGEFRDKIPLNSRGVAPAIIPAVGLSGNHVSGEVVFFGAAGAMVTVGVLF